MRLPNFLYLGAPKAGSTWIFEALKAHPQVFVPPVKDTAYFSDFYDRGIDWYADFFEGATPEHLAVGEVAVTYLLKPERLQRIGAALPGVRLLACVRNPMRRAWSAYTWLAKNGKAKCDFSEEIRKSADESTWVLGAGQYSRSLTDMDRFIDSSEKTVLLFDDLDEDPVSFSKHLYSRLGVDPEFQFERAERNFLPASTARSRWLSTFIKKSAVKARNLGLTDFVGYVKSSSVVHKMLYKPIDKATAPGMSADDWQFLADLYEPDIRYLEQRLDRDLGHWRVPPE